MTGSESFFEQAVATIRNLVAAGLLVRVNIVVTKRNVKQVPDLVRLLFDLGVSMVRSSPMGRSFYVQGTEQLFLDQEEAEWLRSEIKNLKVYGDVSFGEAIDDSFLSLDEKTKRFAGRAMCTAGRWGLVMHSDGKVTLCDEMPSSPEFVVGDLTHQTISEVWESSQIDQLIYPEQMLFEGTVCDSCEDFEACHHEQGRCFRDALKAYGRFHAPAPSCPKAPIGIRLV
jgi:radical SAM protein with 4Fe4S-binding SPASM domain